MTSTTQGRDQRVTNANIFSKLESMNERLKGVEATCGITAEHSIRCGTKWDQYEKDQKRASDRLGKLENHNSGSDKRQIAIIGGVVAVIVAVINVAALVLQSWML